MTFAIELVQLFRTWSVFFAYPNYWFVLAEIQARHKSLAAKLREAEQRQAVIAEQQRSLEVMFRRYDEWIKSAQATISEQINLTSGLNDIRDHIIKLHVSG